MPASSKGLSGFNIMLPMKHGAQCVACGKHLIHGSRLRKMRNEFQSSALTLKEAPFSDARHTLSDKRSGIDSDCDPKCRDSPVLLVPTTSPGPKAGPSLRRVDWRRQKQRKRMMCLLHSQVIPEV